jgi:hypothetical protein
MHRPRHQRRRAHSARSVAHPADAVGALCEPPGQIPGLTAADAESGDRMNAFTANEPKAQDLLSPARLGGDPATMTAPAPRHARHRLTPALMGVG